MTSNQRQDDNGAHEIPIEPDEIENLSRFTPPDEPIYDATGRLVRLLITPKDMLPPGAIAAEIIAGQPRGTLVTPGRLFSFRALVGPPDAAHGFQVGGSIRGDVLAADVGGGLCQLSGLAYELGLRAGMAIVGRPPHTQDPYTDETPLTPTGPAATHGS